MKVKYAALFVPVIIVIALAGAALEDFVKGTSMPDEEAVISTLKAMWAAIERGDVEGYAEYVHPDFTAFGENDVYLAKGKELEMRMMAGYLKRASDVHTEMHQPEVTIRGDVAWILYYWSDEGWSQGKRFTSRGKSTRIFVKEKGKWLCIHGHYTAVP